MKIKSILPTIVLCVSATNTYAASIEQTFEIKDFGAPKTNTIIDVFDHVDSMRNTQISVAAKVALAEEYIRDYIKRYKSNVSLVHDGDSLNLVDLGSLNRQQTVISFFDSKNAPEVIEQLIHIFTNQPVVHVTTRSLSSNSHNKDGEVDDTNTQEEWREEMESFRDAYERDLDADRFDTEIDGRTLHVSYGYDMDGDGDEDASYEETYHF